MGGKSDIFNLGNGKVFSVKEIISAAEKVVGQKIKTKIGTKIIRAAIKESKKYFRFFILGENVKLILNKISENFFILALEKKPPFELKLIRN